MMSDPVGLIAGNGVFPRLFADAAHKQGKRVVAVAMHGETDVSIADHVDAITWVRVGQLGAMIKAFQQAGIHEAAMAGGVKKTRLFGRARPDWLGLKILAKSIVLKDDGLLRAVASAFEQAGIKIISSTAFMPDALAPSGILTDRKPSDNDWQDLRYGYFVAQEIGRLDIGQTVIVRAGAVVALEAIEGTDACIKRAGVLTNKKGAVIVKVAKTVQDMRFDVPAIGPSTIDSMHEANIQVLGIEAHKTLLLEPELLFNKIRSFNICMVGLTEADLQSAQELQT